ncbi:MAG TPA: HAD family phosphatase, partial [Solirubrobacteraceae bacterium]|nr:HAD family phosphatase [Solirubrobacteraceae bacterium]
MSAPLRRFDAVVFDNDGLLLETEGAWTLAEERLFARFGREFTIEDKRAVLGKAGPLAERVLAELLDQPGAGPELFRELQALALEEISRAARPRPGALELIERLRRDGMPLGLASNSSRDFVDRALATAGVSKTLFVATLSGDEVAHQKPAPDIYLAICEALGSEPARTAVLEDSPTGVAAALAAGCFVIGVPSVEGVVLD